MSVMQQSSRAQDKTLGVWFQDIQQGRIKLPRFQRFEAWDRGRITSFLNTLINNLPVGVTLALEVAGEEKFHSRYLATAEPKTPGTVNQHLLDGQQRLTALWRSMHNNYDHETYFVYFPQFNSENVVSDAEPEVRAVNRWFKEDKSAGINKRMPLWADSAQECLSRGLIPVSLLRPEDMASDIDNWLEAATKNTNPSESDPDAYIKFKAYTKKRDQIKAALTELRERIKHFNLPYLSLPAGTGKDVALQVFINMNTNSKPLDLYDIIVAEVESVTESSLHDLVAMLNNKCPAIGRYGNVSNLILSTSALLQDKQPNMRGMIEMDKQKLLTNWPKLERGLERMASFLDGQRVFDEARLPTNAVLAVIAALYELIPEDGDFLGKAERLLRSYAWSSFFSDRYENSAASRAFVDFKALRALLLNPAFSDDELTSVPALNRLEFPLPDNDSLMSAGWPKSAGIEARAILAVTTYLGAIDFADHKIASYESIQMREYHHVFPDSLLKEAGIESYLALNCALITWKTNRIIGRKDPLDYLQQRVQWADEEVVRQRLKSHLISYDILNKAHYLGIEGEAFKAKVASDFKTFLQDRAMLVASAMKQLTEGSSPTLDSLWANQPNGADKVPSEGIT